MLAANNSTPLWLCVVPLVFGTVLAAGSGCSNSSDKNDATGGTNSSGTGGTQSGGTQAGSTQSSGGSSAPTGGASTGTKATGGTSNSTGGASTGTKATGGTSNSTGGASTGTKATGGTSNSTGGASTGTKATGGTSNSTGGASTSATGGGSCIPASTDLPTVHPTDEGDKACSGCHATAITGGFVFDASGASAVAGATVTIKPANGATKTAITGNKGMFRFSGEITAPFQACVSKCPDTVCSTLENHQDAGDCGTCHGVTSPKIHLP